jgi:GAF domain-containing protein
VGVDREALEASLRWLDLQAVVDVDLASLLNQIVTAATQIFAVDGAGLMIANTRRELRYVASSDRAAQVLEAAQLQTGEGPCVDAFVLDRSVRSTDVVADDRWPRLGLLLEGSKIRGVLGMPVRVGGGPVGTLDAYVDHPRAWDDDDVDALGAYAQVIENLLAIGVAAHRSDQLAGQLQYALDYRVAIERAIGFVMARDGVDPVTAFNRLRAKARNSRRKIGDVAAEVMRGQPLG